MNTAFVVLSWKSVPQGFTPGRAHPFDGSVARQVARCILWRTLRQTTPPSWTTTKQKRTSDTTSLPASADTVRRCLGRHSGDPAAYLLYGCSFLSRRTGCFSPRPLRSRPKTPPIRSTITSKISRIHIMPSGAVTLLWISFSTFQPGDRRSCQFSVFFRFRLFQPPF